MRFQILGPLSVLDDADTPVGIGGSKRRALLAMLVLEAGRTVSVGRLVQGIWGEDAGDRAAKTLQVHVSNIRKVLDPQRGRNDGSPERIATVEPGYRFTPHPEDGLDVREFDDLVQRARQGLSTSDPDAALPLLERAIGLWRGPALEDLEGLPFHGEAVAALEESRLGAIELRIEAQLALGQHARMAPELERLVTAHPFRERLWGDLMLVLYRCGRQADALATFERVRALLADELGIDPSARLDELHQAILRQDPSLDGPELRTEASMAVAEGDPTDVDDPGVDAPIRVVLVDDHPMWLDTLSKVLSRPGLAEVVARAGDGESAVPLVSRLRPDVVLMDIELPALDGIGATRKVTGAHPGVRVLVLSGSEDREHVVAAVQAGASGYLLKTAGPDEVRDAVRRIHAGELVFPPALADVVMQEFRRRAVDGVGPAPGSGPGDEGGDRG